MNTIKAIETEYKGYRFRSRLEARWAVFFDALNFKWEYELEGFDLGEFGWYLPDFWLPEAMFHAEVKPAEVDGKELERLDYFDRHVPEPSCGVIWLIGPPTLWDGFPDWLAGAAEHSGTWHVVGRHLPRPMSLVEYAINAARSARFEHGEKPAVRR